MPVAKFAVSDVSTPKAPTLPVYSNSDPVHFRYDELFPTLIFGVPLSNPKKIPEVVLL